MQTMQTALAAIDQIQQDLVSEATALAKAGYSVAPHAWVPQLDGAVRTEVLEQQPEEQDALFVVP